MSDETRRTGRVATAVTRLLIAVVTRLVMVAAIAATFGVRAASAQIACGGTVAPGQTVVLQADLECDDVETAIVVRGPAVLDLNGFALDCNDRNDDGREVITGISLEGSGATVRGGFVRGCRQGVALRGEGRHLLSGTTVLGSSSDDVRIESDRNRVVEAFAFFGRGAGFFVQGNANRVLRSSALGNRFGFNVEKGNVLEGNVASDAERGFVTNGGRSVLRGNRAVGCDAGFEVRGDGARLLRNQAERNRFGILFDELAERNVLTANVVRESGDIGILVVGDANRLASSRVDDSGGDGIRLGFGATRTFVRGSTVRDSGGVDLSDRSPGCGSNRWRSNASGTRDQSCIQ